MKEKISDIIIYGAGDLAALITHLVEREGIIKVAAYMADAEFVNSGEFNGRPLLELNAALRKYPPGDYKALLCVGYKNMRFRKLMFDKLISMGYEPINFISSKAMTDGDFIQGSNNIIFPGAHIEHDVILGDNNIIWSDALICHGARIASHNFLAAGTILGGYSEMGSSCFLGFRATVSHNKKIADETLLAACSFLNLNTEERSKYAGVPALKIGTHDGITID